MRRIGWRDAPALSDYQHVASGKVREIYRVDDEHLLLVASDRISAYDYVLTAPSRTRAAS